MKALFRILGILLLVVALGLAGVLLVSRFGDGPNGFFAGGEMTTGAWVATDDLDWSFASDLPTMEFQLLEPPRSRTVWMVQEGDSLYIPCGLPNFRLWKQWPHEARQDGRAVLRIDGKRYAVNLVYVEDDEERDAVLRTTTKKYELPAQEAADDNFWAFRIEARAHEG